MYQYAQLVHWIAQNRTVFLPASVDIDMTNVCNQDCYYCDSAEFRKQHPTQQPAADYIKLIDQLSTWRNHSPAIQGSVNTICFSGGGEPTMLKGYEKVIEHSILSGFRTSLTTNGTNLNRLTENISHDTLRKIAWIGVDVDAGTELLYEQIRRSKTSGVFNKVVANITELAAIGVTIDLKILLNEHNADHIEDIFKLAQQCGARMVYFRPTVIGNAVYDCRPLESVITELSKRYSIKFRLNLKKFQPRTYNRCHQMYQFLIFCPDGKMYTCCENKGNPRFSIGSWMEGDFRDLWLSQQHHNIYNSINTQLCQPCRSHNHNLAIENIMQTPELLDTLFY